MNARMLLARAQSLGIQLWAEGETLQCEGPDEVLTDDLLHQLKANKAELMRLLAAPAVGQAEVDDADTEPAETIQQQSVADRRRSCSLIVDSIEVIDVPSMVPTMNGCWRHEFNPSRDYRRIDGSWVCGVCYPPNGDRPYRPLEVV